jgi:broad specificity phosphatase PhoE
VSRPHEIRLVRHGRAAAGWDTDLDPDLDEVGRAQAEAVAEALPPAATIVTSPLLRCRSTAERFADRTGLEPVVEPAVAEIPSPEGVDIADRVDWLRAAMVGTWESLGERYTAYRDQVVAVVRSLPPDTVVFSHFVAINAVIGACLGDDRLVIRSLDNCSVTTVLVEGDRLTLVEGGHEADTLIR